jgi:hypothetical protein
VRVQSRTPNLFFLGWLLATAAVGNCAIQSLYQQFLNPFSNYYYNEKYKNKNNNNNNNNNRVAEKNWLAAVILITIHTVFSLAFSSSFATSRVKKEQGEDIMHESLCMQKIPPYRISRQLSKLPCSTHLSTYSM